MENKSKEESAKEEDQNKYEDSLPIELSTQVRVIISLVAGAFAGALAKTTIAPLDRTKIVFQISRSKFSTKEALRFLVNSYKKDGILSLWRGNSATMARIVPYAGIQFSSHEQFKALLGNEHSSSRFLAGAMAGMTAQSVTYPLDITRARLAVSKKSEYKNLTDTLLKMAKTEGPTSLFRGYVATMLGVIPYAGFSFFTYETLKKVHAEKFEKSEPSPFTRLLFGGCAGVIGQTSSYPLDIVRRRIQVNDKEIKYVWSGMRKIYREEGIVGGLFKGLSMNWVKGPIGVGISFTTFDLTSGWLRELAETHL